MNVKPRKAPRQARAQATVTAIVEATTQLLLVEGYTHFTTSRVAERAGVSVGSLYQYFPNKAALAAAVVERCCAEFLLSFERALATRPPRTTLVGAVQALVDVALISHRLAPELHRVVRELSPELGLQDKEHDVRREAVKLVARMLNRHSGEIASGIDLMAAATIVEALLETLAHRVVRAGPDDREGEGGALAKEATDMIIRYLKPDP